MRNLRGDYLTPDVAYDPVARVVTIRAPSSPDAGGWLDDGQTYRIDILSPQSPTDANGLRAIDGATLDPSSTATIEFPVHATTPPTPTPPPVDFCRDVFPIFTTQCTSSVCHGGPLPAAGLRLDSPASIAATAIGRVAQGANTGPRAAAEPPGVLFGEDMPVIDPGSGGPSSGAPGDSWLMYKLLMGAPSACSSAPNAPPCDAGAPTPPPNVHAVEWRPLSDEERATLASFVPGREMPYPYGSSGFAGTSPSPLTLQDLENVSRWIAQGARLPPSCP
jgi:hypothetical protein